MKFLGQKDDGAEVFDSSNYWLHHELKAINQEYQWALAQDPSRAETLKDLHRQRSADLHAQEKNGQSLNSGQELLAIEQIIDKHYALKLGGELAPSEEAKLRLESPQPYLRFLLQKRYYLHQKQNLAAQFSAEEKSAAPEGVGATRKWLKVVDVSWAGFQNVYAVGALRAVDGFFSGLFGFILNLGEGIDAGRQAYKAYSEEKSRQRKTKIATGVASFMLGGAGAGFSLALLATFLGGTVSASVAVLMPMLIPGLLVSIYSLTLWRNSYVYYQLRREERVLRKYLKEELYTQNALRYDIHALERKIENLGMETIFDKEKMGKKLSPEEEASKSAYDLLEVVLSTKQEEFARVTLALEAGRTRDQQCRKELSLARRETAITGMEVLSSSLVLVAVILGASALIGASIASFGAIPLSLLVVGVVLGVATKLADHYDATHGYSLSQRLAQWFKPARGLPEEESKGQSEEKPLSPSLADLYKPDRKRKRTETPSQAPKKTVSPQVRFQLTPEQEVKAQQQEAKAKAPKTAAKARSGKFVK